MSIQMYKVFPGWAAGRILTPVILLCAMTLLNACSSGISRFNYPAFGLNDSGSTASLPVPSEPLYGGQRRSSAPSPDYTNRPAPLNNNQRYGQNNSAQGQYNYQRPSGPSQGYGNGNRPTAGNNQGSGNNQGYANNRGYGSNLGYTNSSNANQRTQNNVRMARLPEPNPSNGPLPTRGSVPQVTYNQPEPVKAASNNYNNSAGRTVEVAQGQTLYGIAKANNVSFEELKTANNLQGNSVRIGQKLVIPGRGGQHQQTAYVTPTKRQNSNNARTVRAQPVIRNRKTGRTYRVVRGDSLYAIAGRHGMSSAELASHNGISQSTTLKLGQTLSIPSTARIVTVRKRNVSKPTQVAVRQGRSTAAARLPKPAIPSASKFRWPVQGRIISRFGSKHNGTHNDGLNLAVPAGTSVRAAENGVVAYAGSELKGYGNLILVRHANNWVSAYAHMDQIMVKRGDNISRGQVIAKSGRTGNVDRPQVHFELRKNSKPVNPLTHLASR